jgi:flap endonuclease-1
MGFFYRTIRMVENGIKPVYVFDGKPPVLKSGEASNHIYRVTCILILFDNSWLNV